MEPEILQNFLQLGIVGVLAFLYIKQSVERDKHERERDKKRDQDDTVITNNTAALTSLNSTLERNLVVQNELVKDILEIKSMFTSHSKQGEKIFTEIVTNNHVSQTKLDAIVREAFSKRVGDEIQAEVAVAKKEVEKKEKEQSLLTEDC